MNANAHPLAVVTGASSGIGYQLAMLCARNGFDLVVAADDPRITETARDFEVEGVAVEPVEVDLATPEGVEELVSHTAGRDVDALLANAGHGLGGEFLDQEFDEIEHVIDTNVTGTVHLVHRIARDMRSRNRGRILITGSIAGHTPGPLHAVYHGTKAFVDSFAAALRNELKDSGVTVTCLKPGATETEFFERAGMTETKVGQEEKADPAEVAKTGFEAMMSGEGDVVAGAGNKLRVAMSGLASEDMMASQARKENEPEPRKPKAKGRPRKS